jgi:hypothetical protein
MARYTARVKTGAGSTTLPLMSLYAAAAVEAAIVEIGVTNTSAVALDLHVARLTTAGTQGAGLTEAKHNPASVAASSTAFTTHTVAPTLGDSVVGCSLGAAIGGGYVWTFGDGGLIIPVGTGNGVGVLIENGTGQPLQAYMIWDE